MNWIDIVLAGFAGLMTFATLQVTGTDRLAWGDGKKRTAYISLVLFGLAVVGTAVWSDASSQTSAIGVGFAVGLLVGILLQLYRGAGRVREPGGP